MTKQTKKPIIVLGINSLTVSQYPAYSNHIQVMYRLGRQYTEYDFCLVNPPRMTIDRMRNMAAEVAMSVEAKYLCFIDDDVLLPMNQQPEASFSGLQKLIDLDADIAAGDVIIRGYPFNHMLFKYTDKTRTGLEQIKRLPRERGPMPVDAVGFSFALIKVDLLRELEPPYFITGVSNTEDIYFCVKARDKFPDCKIMADTSVVCGHILWPEIIDSFNKANYTKYWERQFGKPSKKKTDDRGAEYLSKVKGVLRNEKTS